MPPLNPEITAMLDRVRQVFGDEILAGVYERAQNAAVRQAGTPATSPPGASTDGTLRLVSGPADEGFLQALRDELERLLTRQ